MMEKEREKKKAKTIKTPVMYTGPMYVKPMNAMQCWNA